MTSNTYRVDFIIKAKRGKYRETLMEDGQWLRQNRDRVLQTWEERVREAIPPARPLDAPVLTNSIPDLYDRLMDVLASQAAPETAGVFFGRHGEERSRLRGYDLDFVIEEFQILHRTILETAQEHRPLEARSADAILEAINLGVLKAASEFVNVRAEQLAHAKRDAERASSAKSFFLETMSHEIKTPLGVILGNVELLKDATEPERGKHFKVIAHQGQLLSKLVDAILDLANAEVTAKLRLSPGKECGHLRILLVDDSIDNQDYIRQLLMKRGMEVECANNGREAVDKAKSDFYDIIIMDVQMPVLDGYQATRELRDDGYRKPIVSLTAHKTGNDRRESRDAGCDAHLTKPVDKHALFRTIHDLQHALH